MFNFQPEYFNGTIGLVPLAIYILITGVAFFCAYYVYPTIIYLSHIKNLSQAPNTRSSHTVKTPVLGGVGIFIGFLLSAAMGFFLLHPNLNLLTFIAVFLGCCMLFIVGLKDDILPIRALVKLMAQIGVSCFIICITKNEIASLQGLFGIYEMPSIMVGILTVFVYVVIINGFNLIDGIDGLAGLQSIMLSSMFGIYFAINNLFTITLLACCLLGALIAFLYFNFSKRRKIFMGDSGSIFVGFLMAFFTVFALKMTEENTVLYIKNSAVVIMSMLSYPLIDTLRVFSIRMYNRCSPFAPDRNHLHHVLIDLGIRHRNASIGINLYTLTVTGLALSLNFLEINTHFIIMTLIVITSVGILLLISRLKNKKANTIHNLK